MLPTTGPRVQKPIAEARPSCGEKSRTSAGVATRITPSTRPITTRNDTKTVLFGASGVSRESTPVTARP
jgi:hypothetical protein